MNSINIKPKPLNVENFKPFGQVICPKGNYTSSNQETGKKWNDLAYFDMFDQGGEVNLAILRTMNIAPEFSKMERHKLTSQIFIPLGGKRSLVAVAPPSEKEPVLEHVEVFLVEGNQGVSFYRNTWHHTLFPLDGETDYVVITRGGNIPIDVELMSFKKNIRIVIDW